MFPNKASQYVTDTGRPSSKVHATFGGPPSMKSSTYARNRRRPAAGITPNSEASSFPVKMLFRTSRTSARSSFALDEFSPLLTLDRPFSHLILHICQRRSNIQFVRDYCIKGPNTHASKKLSFAMNSRQRFFNNPRIRRP